MWKSVYNGDSYPLFTSQGCYENKFVNSCEGPRYSGDGHYRKAQKDVNSSAFRARFESCMLKKGQTKMEDKWRIRMRINQNTAAQ